MDNRDLRKDKFSEKGAECPTPGPGGDPSEENREESFEPNQPLNQGFTGFPEDTEVSLGSGGTMGGSLNEPGGPQFDVNEPRSNINLPPEDISRSGYETLSSPDIKAPAPDITVSATNVNISTPNITPSPPPPQPTGLGGLPSLNIENLPQKASETAEMAANKTKEQAHVVVEKSREVKERANSMVSESSEQIANAIHQVSEALHGSAQKMEQGQYPKVGEYVHSAAESLDHLSMNMRGKDISYFIESTESMARRRPGLFIGSAVALGFAIGRFLKSSSRTSFGPTSSGFRPSGTTTEGRQYEYDEPSVATLLDEDVENRDVY